ncbi:MAG TPA: glycosyltransferase [Candidatus Limnocylindrales bacterium]
MTEPLSPAGPPADITHLVRERIEARNRHDWPRADALKAEIEAAGWKVTDRGNRTSVSPAAPATLNVGGEVRYGAAGSVPSRLAEPATYPWTVIVLASEQPDRVSRLLAALRSQAPAGTQVVVVANDPSDGQVTALLPGSDDLAPIAGTAPELIRTSTRLGHAPALNIALQRAAGELILLTDASAWPIGDAITPLAAALADPQVAVAGAFGLSSAEPGPLRPGAMARDLATDAAALEAAWLAFRRSDFIELGPLDERFVTPAWLDLWWTLRLRAGAEPEGAEYVESAEANEPTDKDASEQSDFHESDVEMPAPRRAVRLDLPLERDEVAWPPDRSRLNRRNMYRVLDRFGWRADLT